MNSPPSEQALAFYSRYHIEYVKLPDLKYSQKKQQELVDAIERKEPVCCSAEKVDGLVHFRPNEIKFAAKKT